MPTIILFLTSKVKRVMDMSTFLDELPTLAFDVFGL